MNATADAPNLAVDRRTFLGVLATAAGAGGVTGLLRPQTPFSFVPDHPYRPLEDGHYLVYAAEELMPNGDAKHCPLSRERFDALFKWAHIQHAQMPVNPNDPMTFCFAGTLDLRTEEEVCFAYAGIHHGYLPPAFLAESYRENIYAETHPEAYARGFRYRVALMRTRLACLAIYQPSPQPRPSWRA